MKEIITKLLSSASKLVFILLALAAVVGFCIGRLNEANFMLLAGGAFTFYFANKGDGGKTPYAGK